MRIAALAAAMVIVTVVAGRPAAAAPATEVETKAAKAVITSWLAAQNRRDFAGYQALYAPAFAGVKRVGTTTKRMDRTAWLADRKTMFKSAMAVSATGVVVTSDGARLTVELEQRWQQGTFADAGQKRFVLDRAAALAGQPAAILGEEMLSSKLVLANFACVRALYPDAPSAGDRIGRARGADKIRASEVLDLGNDRYVCRVDTQARGDDATKTEIAIVKRGKGATALGRIEHSITTSKTAGRDGAEERGGNVTISLEPLTATDSAVVVAVEETTADVHQSKTTEVTTLYRATDAGLAPLLDFTSTTTSDVEDTGGTSCELEVKTHRTRGYPDLAVRCTESHGDWWNDDVSKRGVKQTTTTTRYRWTGSTYEERR